MRLLIIIAASLVFFAACATDDAAKDGFVSHHVDVMSKSDAVAQSPEGKYLEESRRGHVKGEPVTSTSFAIRLAELVLRERGLDPSERSVLVSFCDDNYSVTYERPLDSALARDWVVCIEATTSRIMHVKTD